MKVFWIANNEVSKFLKSQGLIFNDTNPDALLLTYDTEINYEKMKKLVYFVRRDIPYYATHIDMLCPSLDGPLPDIGTFIDLVKTTTGCYPLKTFGKPNLEMINGKLNEMNLELKDAAIVGDRLYTDIKMAENNDLISILVLSGETTRIQYEFSSIKSDIICKKLEDLIEYL